MQRELNNWNMKKINILNEIKMSKGCTLNVSYSSKKYVA